MFEVKGRRIFRNAPELQIPFEGDITPGILSAGASHTAVAAIETAIALAKRARNNGVME